jgi:hypothetical protein
VLSEVGRELGVTLVTEGLHRADDRRGVDPVAASQRPRGEEEGLVGVLQGGLEQPPPIRRESVPEAGDPFLDGGASRDGRVSFLLPKPGSGGEPFHGLGPALQEGLVHLDAESG